MHVFYKILPNSTLTIFFDKLPKIKLLLTPSQKDEIIFLNLTSHYIKLKFLYKWTIKLYPIVQVRVISNQLRYYIVYSKEFKNLKLISYSSKQKIINKEQNNIIKIVSYPTIKFLTKKYNLSQKKLFEKFGWICVSKIKEYLLGSSIVTIK